MIHNMTITRLEPYKGGKVRVWLNDEPSFVIYRKEVRKYSLKEGEELGEDVYGVILEESLIKRAKSRTLHILDRRDRTEKQLREKLEEDGYPGEAVDAAVEAAIRGKYLDDARYARQYIYEKSRSKSRRVIEAELLERGVPRQMVADAMDESEDVEDKLLRKLVEKRAASAGGAESLDRWKTIAFLCSKGFSCDRAAKAVDDIVDDCN